MCLPALPLSSSSATYRGRAFPGPFGDPEQRITIKAQAFADDLLAFILRGTAKLPLFKRLLRIYETGSGCNNNWNTSESLLRGRDARLPPASGVGSYARSPATGSHFPWGRLIGRLRSFYTRGLRALGHKDRPRCRRHVCRVWSSRRVPNTSNGRNLVVRNLAYSLQLYSQRSGTSPRTTTTRTTTSVRRPATMSEEGYKIFGPFHFFQFLEHAARSRASHWISQCDV